MTTTCIEPFADGDYSFFLPMSRIVAVEREADCSIFQIFYDLGENLAEMGGETVLAGPSSARLKACHSVIRNALIGGGEAETVARELVDTYCYPARPAIGDMALAWTILRAVIYGIEVKKKSDVADDRPSHSAKDGSSATAASSDSTGSAPASATTSKRSRRTAGKKVHDPRKSQRG